MRKSRIKVHLNISRVTPQFPFRCHHSNLHCRCIGPKIPRAPVHDVATLVWNQELSRLSPDGPPIASLPPNRIHRLWVTPWRINGRRTKMKNPQSLAVEGLNDGVPGRIRTCDAGIRRTALRRLGCRSNALQSLSINEFTVRGVYPVAPKLPVTSFRGDAVVTDGLETRGTRPVVGATHLSNYHGRHGTSWTCQRYSSIPGPNREGQGPRGGPLC